MLQQEKFIVFILDIKFYITSMKENNAPLKPGNPGSSSTNANLYSRN